MDKFRAKIKSREKTYITVVLLNSICLIVANKWIVPNIQISDLLKDVFYWIVLVIEIVLIVFIMRVKIILSSEATLKNLYKKTIKNK